METNIPANISMENIHLSSDVIHMTCKWKEMGLSVISNELFMVEVKCADNGCLGTVVSLLIGLLYASLQLPLDNHENKNS